MLKPNERIDGKMKQVLFMSLLWLSCTVVNGCKNIDRIDESSLQESPDAAHVARSDYLLVVHGGNNSCEMKTNPNYGRTRGSARETEPTNKNHDPDSLSGERRLAFPMQTELYQKALSDTPESIKSKLMSKGYRVTWLVSCYPQGSRKVYFTDSSKQQDPAPPTTREALWQRLQTLGSGVDRIVIIGHSYGGWTAMKSAFAVGTNIDLLVTIDPISLEKCTHGSWIMKGDYCKMFPPDFETFRLESLASLTGEWLHFWQTQQASLHSGPVSIMNPNLKEERIAARHDTIDTNDRVWRSIEEALQ